MKVISLCGIEKGDFVYYLAAVLSQSGSAVLVIDNSYSNDIYGAISSFEETEKDYIVRQNLTFMKNVMYQRDSEEELFDYVLIWHGMNVKKAALMQSDEVYLLPDYSPVTLMHLRRRISDRNNLVGVYFRESVVSNKISDKSAVQYLGIPEEKIKGAMAYDSGDYENYLAFLYNGRQTFNKLSPNFNEGLKEVARIILETDKKDIEKVFGKAKKAKSF